MSALDRAYFDMLAYGRHFETCSKGRVLAETLRGQPLRDKRCSCGLDAALDGLEAARSASPPPAGGSR